jgi:hypothetical protein
MKGIKLKVVLLDKRNWFDFKGKYFPQTRLVEVKSRLKRQLMRFQVDPDHFYEHHKRGRRELAVFIDNAERKSITVKQAIQIIEGDQKKTELKDVSVLTDGSSVKLSSDQDIDQKKSNELDYLIEPAFWKALIERRKLAISTILILLFAGVGLYHFLLVVLRTFGIQV